MAEQIHVNGEAHLQVGTGSGGALQLLGVSVDGVEGTIEDHTKPIMTDTFGPDVPFDEQQFLQTATVNAALVFYDDGVLGAIRGRASGTDGEVGQAGQLWGAGGLYFRLLITSPIGSLPYNFPHARMTGSWRHKEGTQKTIWNVSFFCVPYTGVAGSTSGAVLYNRSTS
jgi:hypothetical protein